MQNSAVIWFLLTSATPPLCAQADVGRKQGAQIWEGTLERIISDDFEHGRTSETIQLRQGTKAIRLNFDKSKTQCPSGGFARIRGVGSTDGVLVSEVESITSADDSLCSTMGEQRTAVILLKFPSSPPQSITADVIRKNFFSDDVPSLNSYWKASSGQRTWVSGEVFGWYTLV
jgi:hypothetical protein